MLKLYDEAVQVDSGVDGLIFSPGQTGLDGTQSGMDKINGERGDRGPIRPASKPCFRYFTSKIDCGVAGPAGPVGPVGLQGSVEVSGPIGVQGPTGDARLPGILKFFQKIVE